jgi:hypothetical protein
MIDGFTSLGKSQICVIGQGPIFFCTSLHQKYLFSIFQNIFSTSYLYFQIHNLLYFMNFYTLSIVKI